MLPQELEDAAKVDGCNSWTALWQVLLPVVRPAVLTLVVLLFVWTWNDFRLALVLVTSERSARCRWGWRSSRAATR